MSCRPKLERFVSALSDVNNARTNLEICEDSGANCTNYGIRLSDSVQHFTLIGLRLIDCYQDTVEKLTSRVNLLEQQQQINKK